MMAAKALIHKHSIRSLLEGFVDCPSLPDLMVSGISVDSRKVKPGYMFIVQTMAGQSNATFINDAVRNGAIAVIADDDLLPDSFLCPLPVVRIGDMYKKTGEIAARFYGHPSADMSVIGITGTNGKTTVSHLLAQTLSDSARGVCGLIGTLGYGPFDRLTASPNTTPDPVLLQSLLADMRSENIRQVVIEVSSHGLDQCRIASVSFDVAIFTNLSRDHLDYHSTLENYAISKQRLFTDYQINKAIINIDDKFGLDLIDNLPANKEIVGYTLDSNKRDKFSRGILIISGAIRNIALGEMTMEIDSPWGTGLLITSLFGKFNAYNLLAALSALCLSGSSLDYALERLSQCKNITGRMECFITGKSPRVIVDYAHTPDALEQVLSVLRSICSGKLFCVFGCGGDRDRGKRIEMGTVAGQYADSITLTNDNPRYENPDVIIHDIAQGISRNVAVTVESNRESAIRNTILSATGGDIVLIAGKGHEDYQEISGIRRPFSDQKIITECLGQYQ